ncbi:6-carboxytetrahydropterin synthase QueD [Negadavirga shengliensis]|uniref:6-carboxy-5,6,7,8-tetrahydropterin synthase n=1 Tax=Negadavirga shengliensis TaxID=1389218 RepID=A0ABV9SYR6_9BACT
MLSITKIFTFEAAHRISNHPAACSQLHGHSYKLHVTIGAEEPGDDDMLMDFKELKTLVQHNVIDKLDHSLMLKNIPSHLQTYANAEKVFWMDHEPTAERLVLWIAQVIKPLLPSKVNLNGLKIYETETCYVNWENNKR